MSTTIAPRPPAQTDRRGSGTGPAITRLARRTARGQGRRRVLVLVVIAVAVAAGVSAGALTATLARNDVERGPVDRFGDADLLVETFRGLSVDDQLVELTPAQQTWLDEHPVAVGVTTGTDVGEQDPGRQHVREVALADVLASLPAGARSLVARTSNQLGFKSYGPEAFVTDMDLSDALVGDTFLFDGPARTLVGDEAMVSPGYLADLGAAVGDTIPVPRVGDVTVVGTVTRSLQRSQRVVVVAPGRDLGGLLYLEQLRVGLPEDLDVATQRNAIGEALAVRADELRAELPDRQDGYVNVGTVESTADYRAGLGDPTGVATLVAGVTSGLAAVLAGILAACAFAVGVRRRIRQIGMLGAVGADPAQLARLLRREGLLLGLGGAVLGTALGAVISVVGLPVVERVGDRELTLTLPLMAVLLPLVLGAAAAMAAAAWPARTAARVPVVQALAGRVPLGRLPAWVPVAGLGAGVLGVLLLGQVSNGSGAAGDELDALLAVAGSMLATLGTAAAGLPMLVLGARVADRLPFLPRMAVRDSARQRSRSGVAVAALIPVLAMPVAAYTTWTSAVNTFVGGGPSSYVAPEPGPWAMLSGPSVADGRVVPPSVEDVAAARRVLPPSEVVADVVQLADPQRPDVGMAWRPPDVAPGMDGYELAYAPITLATPQLLAALGLDADAVDGADVLLLDGAGGYRPPADGVAFVGGPYAVTGATPELSLRVAVDESWVGGGVPSALMAPATADELGLVEVQRLTLLSLARPLTNAEARSLYGGESGLPDTVYVDTVGEPPFLETPVGAALLWAAVVLGVVLVVSIVAVMTASLAATESDDDIRKLVALGAEPAARRRFHGLQAGWHTLVAAVLAVPLGLAVAAAALGWRDIDVPWLASLGWIVGVPVLVGLCIAAVLRSAPVGAPRRRMA